MQQNKYCVIYLINGIKRSRTHRNSRMVVARAEGWGKWGDAGQRGYRVSVL